MKEIDKCLMETQLPHLQKSTYNQKNRAVMTQVLNIVWWVLRVPLIVAQGIIQFVVAVVLGLAMYILFYAMIITGVVWVLIN
ncbi:MAG: hypothetical protein SNI87_00365 [Rikenellaceae bacterium]